MFHNQKRDKPAGHYRTYEGRYGRDYVVWQLGNTSDPLRWRHAFSQGQHNGGESPWIPVQIGQRPAETTS